MKTTEDIKKIVCEMTGVDPLRMQSKTRKRDVVYARHLCYWALRNYTTLSLAKIGSMIGSKDHATVLHGVRVIDIESEISKQVQRDTQEIDRQLRGRIVWVSGAITGHNYADVLIRFNTAKKKLEALGFEVIIPMDVVPDGTKSWEKCMAYCRKAIFEMSSSKEKTIYMLKGWRRSSGAIDELRHAKMLGFRVVYE